MLTRIQVANRSNLADTITDFVLGDSHIRTGYTIKEVEGLGPSDAEVHTSAYAAIPGGFYQSSRVVSRNVVINLGFSPDYLVGESILSLRRRLYTLYPTGAHVRLRLWNMDRTEMRIDGYVESYTPSMFTKDPELQISILCPNPFFSAPSGIVEDGLTTGAFEVDYLGDVPSGVRVDVYPLRGTATEIQLINTSQDPETGFTLKHDLPHESVLSVNTNAGQKSVRLTNPNGSINRRLVGKINIQREWLTLYPGPNRLVMSRQGTGGISWRLRYSNLFAGF